MAYKSNKQHKEFSKILIKQESALIWILTLSLIPLTYICVFKGYLGTLPWLTGMIAAPWAAYGVSQACYYNKAKAENTTGGIKFESMIASLPKDSDTKTDNIDPFGSI